ncbi:MAG: tetratricopeptide repeat protein, partial [bacterium]
ERHSLVIATPLLLSSTGNQDYASLLADLPPATVPAWREYVNSKLVWRRERFTKEYPGRPYLTSVREELESIGRAIEKWNAMKLEDPSLRDEDLDFLRQIWIDEQLDSFVYLELFTEEYRSDFERWKLESKEKLLSYIQEYVVGQAQANLRNGHNLSAIKAYNEGVSLHQSNPARAIELYLRALEHEPFRINALANLTYLYVELEKYDEAQATIERWIAIEGESAKPLEMLAMTYIHKTQFDLAIDALEKASQLEEDSEELNRIKQNLDYCRYQSQTH